VFRLEGVPDPAGAGVARLYFTAVSNKTYSVEYRDSLSVGEWVTLANYDSLPVTRVQWVTNLQEGGLEKRYYRVKTPLNGPEPLGDLKLAITRASFIPHNSSVILSFTAVANRSYSVEYQQALGSSLQPPASRLWTTLVSYDAVPMDRVIWVTNTVPLGPTNVFYRLKAPRND
jgi:hypothetical protein